MAFVDTGGSTGPAAGEAGTHLNVSRPERWVSAFMGGAALAYGLTQRRIAGWSTALTGGVLVYRGLTGRCPLYTLFGFSTARSDTRAALGGDLGIRLTTSIVINRPPEELYRFWQNVENLPQVMTHLTSVRPIADGRSRWVARGPAGLRLEWNAKIINTIENKLIAWRSLDGSDVISAGSVHFDQVFGGGTRLTVTLQYSAAPGGRVGTALAALLGEDPSKQIEADLWQFKRTMEDTRLLIAPSPLAPVPSEGVSNSHARP